MYTLNEGLARIGREVSFCGRLSIEGVPTLADVEVAESELAAGSKSFEKVMEPFMRF
jgi:hypothetical protein